MRRSTELIFDLMWKADKKDNYTIFHMAVLNRQEELFKFIHDIKSIADLMVESCDREGNNILHLAGKLAPQHRLNVVAGSALQMQRELLWFEAVKEVVPAKLGDAKNNEGLTPGVLFSKEHKELMSKGETWMKEIASSCMIVAEEDFLHSLPRKLLVGFATLFIAIAAMMVVFSAASYIVFKDGSLWIAILAIVISSMPVILFVKQHFLFFKDVLRSTYASDYLIRKGKPSVFYKEGETRTKQQKKTKLFNGSNLTIPLTSSCSTNV